MNAPFVIDGVGYNVLVPAGGLKRSASVLDGQAAGRVTSGDMKRDIIGTYYNYTLEIDTKGLDVAQYDALYEVLSAPQDFHMVVFPYGQSTLSFKAYVSNVEDTLQIIDGRVNFWGGMSVVFTAMSPQRRPR